MNHLEKSASNVQTIGKFSQEYFSYLSTVLNSISENEINKLGEHFELARSNGNTIFVAGNGGSAATATTMANDIGFDIIKKTDVEKAFRVHSLVDNNSVVTAIANDVGYENIFVNQLKIHYRNDDSLIIISASGNSPNVLKAVKWVKSKGGKIIGFLGFSGGKIIDYCDIKILVDTQPGEYGPVEDAHLIMNHILAHWFQNKLK